MIFALANVQDVEIYIHQKLRFLKLKTQTFLCVKGIIFHVSDKNFYSN